MDTAKSPLRYPGGKSRAITAILAQLPARFREYREPFLGGGSVYLAIKSRRACAERYWINDLYLDLYDFWRVTRDDIGNLTRAVWMMRTQYPDDGVSLYQSLKRSEGLTPFERAVRFFIMNRITFSGVMDAGGYSQQAFEKRFTPSSIQRLEAVSAWFQRTTITNEDYSVLLEAPGEDVVIFLDPPYLSNAGSRLYGKNGALHAGFDHERFANALKSCSHRWLVTYDDSAEVRELFSFASITEWSLQYGMNNYKQPSAAKGRELFIRNY